MPRTDKTVKRLFIPSEGNVFTFADWSQIEPRLTAYFMAKQGNPELAEFIRDAGDAYMATAVGVYHRPIENITKEERQTCKTVFLSLLYGAGTRKLASSLGVPVSEAKRIRAEFYDAWPAVPELLSGILATYRKRGYIKTPWGRRLHPHSDHAAINHLVQGSAADLMKQALVSAHVALAEGEFATKLVATVHDELIFDGPPEERRGLESSVIRPSMTDERINEVVPIVVDIEWSDTNWAEKRPLEVAA
jgi:DNA polymerase-1